jgi:predicted small metal-binding protein
LNKAFELSEFTKQLSYCGFRKRHPGLSDAELKKMFLEHLKKCHNRNY